MKKSDMMVSKIFSARWFMTILTSICASLLTGIALYICYKAKNMEAGIAIVMFYLGIWKEIAMFYFNRADRDGEASVTVTQPKPDVAAALS